MIGTCQVEAEYLIQQHINSIAASQENVKIFETEAALI